MAKPLPKASEEEIHKRRRMGNCAVTHNMHGYRGVAAALDKGRHKAFYAGIWINGKRKRLGYFYTAREAALAYDTAARLAYGRKAFLNFPSKKENSVVFYEISTLVCAHGHDLTVYGYKYRKKTGATYIQCRRCNALSQQRRKKHRLSLLEGSHGQAQES